MTEDRRARIALLALAGLAGPEPHPAAGGPASAFLCRVLVSPPRSVEGTVRPDMAGATTLDHVLAGPAREGELFVADTRYHVPDRRLAAAAPAGQRSDGVLAPA